MQLTTNTAIRAELARVEYERALKRRARISAALLAVAKMRQHTSLAYGCIYRALQRATDARNGLVA